ISPFTVWLILDFRDRCLFRGSTPMETVWNLQQIPSIRKSHSKAFRAAATRSPRSEWSATAFEIVRALPVATDVHVLVYAFVHSAAHAPSASDPSFPIARVTSVRCDSHRRRDSRPPVLPLPEQSTYK